MCRAVITYTNYSFIFPIVSTENVLKIECSDNAYNFEDLHSLVWKYVLLDPRRMVPPICVFDPCSKQSKQIKNKKQDSFFNLISDFSRKISKYRHLRHKYDVWAFGMGIKFSTVSILHTKNRSCKLYDSNLHSKTNAKEWNPVFAGISSCNNLSLHSSIPKPSWNQHTICTLKAETS